jgi:hypothetical protein
MINLESHGQEINRLHTLAKKMAIDAVEHARSAGLLLLEAKKEMKHGKFLLWVRDNVQVSLRQAQRYMAVAQGKTIPLRRLIEKSDTAVSLLNKTNKIKESGGVWIGDRWEPEDGYLYLFNDGQAAYWVTPSGDSGKSFHVCKHYHGVAVSSDGFYWRYTILAKLTDPDLTSDFYIGTRFAIHNKSEIEGVLKSYGLLDLKSSFMFGAKCVEPDDRPFGEPDPKDWYWNSELPFSDLVQALKKQGYRV